MFLNLKLQCVQNVTILTITFLGLANQRSKLIYEKANTNVEEWSKMIFRMSKGTVAFCMGPNLAYTLIIYFTKGLENKDYINFMYPAW